MGSKCIAIHPALLYCIMSHLRLALRVHDPAISTDSPVMDIVMDTCTCPPPSPEVLVALHGAVAKRRRNCVTSTILTPWLSSPDTNFTLLFMQGRVDVWEGGLLSALPACTLTKMKEVVSPTLLLPWFRGVTGQGTGFMGGQGAGWLGREQESSGCSTLNLTFAVEIYSYCQMNGWRCRCWAALIASKCCGGCRCWRIELNRP